MPEPVEKIELLGYKETDEFSIYVWSNGMVTKHPVNDAPFAWFPQRGAENFMIDNKIS